MIEFKNFARTSLLILSATVVFCGTADSDSLQVLHSFSGTDGAAPTGLVQSIDGLSFYGVGANGGDTTACAPDGCGVVFKSDLGGNVSLLYTFHATDGYLPTGIVETTTGKLYGTTVSGGQPSGGGAGTIFQIMPNRKFSVLYAFTGGFACCDGAGPVAHPILGADGKLYGTTGAGGAYRDIDHQGGFGTVYSFDPKTRTIAILHSFNLPDGNGIYPNGPLLDGKDGFLYGTTSEHGAAGGGTLFKIDSAGNFSLVAQLPAMQPLAGVILGNHQDFYGTGENGGGGTAFRVDSNGQLSIVNAFDGADGFGPAWPLLLAPDHRFYGTAHKGGLLDFQGGDIFRLASNGSLRILHSFVTNGNGGFSPNSALIQGSDGALYGTTGAGGSGGHGTLFRLDPADLGEVASINVNPKIVIAGRNATGKVTLFTPAPSGGTVVTLGAQQGQIVIPPSVTVPEGQTTAKFKIKTMDINQAVDVRIYASTNGQGTRTTITVTP